MGFHLKKSFLKVCQQNNIRTAIKIVCIFHTRLYGRVMYKYEYCSTILMRNDIAILKILLRYRKQNFCFSLVPAIRGHKNVSSLDFFCCSIALSYSYLSKNNNDLILVYHIFEKKNVFQSIISATEKYVWSVSLSIYYNRNPVGNNFLSLYKAIADVNIY